MDIKNQVVKHRTLGKGTIIAQDDKYITVEFSARTSRFMYPGSDVFEKFLTLENADLQAAIIKEAEEAKAAAELARQQEEERKRKAEEAARAAELARKEAELAARKSGRGGSSSKVEPAKTVRVPGKPLLFYVFQGDTFEIESHGGFIWAPQHSQSGSKVFHWDNMLLVRKGDIVLHGCNGYVVAVSIAVSDCYDCNRPKERTFEDSWNNKGRRVDLKYSTFSNPVKTSDFNYEILKYCKAKYSPFDKDGNGNMGYLFEINRELARVFLQAAVRSNPYLSDLDYVKDLLAEE